MLLRSFLVCFGAVGSWLPAFAPSEQCRPRSGSSCILETPEQQAVSLGKAWRRLECSPNGTHGMVSCMRRVLQLSFSFALPSGHDAPSSSDATFKVAGLDADGAQSLSYI